MTRHMSRSFAATGFIVAGSLLVLAGSGLTATRALAVFHEVTETGNPGLLTLAVHENTPLWVPLKPGDSAVWHVRSSLSQADHGEIEIELDAYGELIDAASMTVRVDACTQHFDPATLTLTSDSVLCTGTRTVVLPPTSLASLASSGARYQLTPLYQNAPRELLVTLSVPGTVNAQAIAGEVGHVGLGVHARGESSEGGENTENGLFPPVSGELQVTGSDVSALALLTFGMIFLVIGFAVVRRSRIAAARGGGG